MLSDVSFESADALQFRNNENYYRNIRLKNKELNKTDYFLLA